VINWNDLRYFLAIHREGSLGGAARTLKVDQTTVGRRLSALEDALAVRLFDRTSDGLSLTIAGERVLRHASDFEERFGSMESVVRGGDARPEGTVRIATSENIAVPFLLERILRVRRTHPGLDLEVVTGSASVNLLRREADLAVRISPRALPAQQNLIARKVADVAITLYATRGYLDAHPPVDLADGLAGHEVVLFDADLADTPPGRWIAENAKAARAVLRVNSFLGAASAASTGTVLALLPCFVTEMWPTLERATASNVMTNEVWLLVQPELLKTARVRTVVDHLVAELEAAKDLLRGAARATD
jgi:DNA-binding transcriptional LysR family regulator